MRLAERAAALEASGSTTTLGARGPDIAETIRSLQRRRPETRLRWTAYCAAHFQGIKDLGRHTNASIARFLASEMRFLATDAGDVDEYRAAHNWFVTVVGAPV